MQILMLRKEKKLHNNNTFDIHTPIHFMMLMLLMMMKRFGTHIYRAT